MNAHDVIDQCARAVEDCCPDGTGLYAVDCAVEHCAAAVRKVKDSIPLDALARADVCALRDALTIARMALTQVGALSMRIAGNGPTVGDVIDRAMPS